MSAEMNRRFNLGPDRSGKTVGLYRAVYRDRFEGAEMAFESKSDRAAFRIASSYEVERRGAFDYRACTLTDVLKFDGYAWRGLDRSLIECYSRFLQRCAGCLQRKPKAWMTESNGENFCQTCVLGHAVIELMLPQIPLIESEMEDLVA